jgi:hypothetical protein
MQRGFRKRRAPQVTLAHAAVDVAVAIDYNVVLPRNERLDAFCAFNCKVNPMEQLQNAPLFNATDALLTIAYTKNRRRSSTIAMSDATGRHSTPRSAGH